MRVLLTKHGHRCKDAAQEAPTGPHVPHSLTSSKSYLLGLLANAAGAELITALLTASSMALAAPARFGHGNLAL
jgi:hypothetical protein